MNATHGLKSFVESPAPIEKPARQPASRVRLMAFVLDSQSEASLRLWLSQQPVPDAIVKRGGIAKAVRYLAAGRSPETIIVDISGAEMPASQLHELVELCEPGVALIAIGDRNDIALYRDLVQAGVSEYVVKPVTVQLLGKALSTTLTTGGGGPVSRKLGKMVALVGARGGVGTTTLAVNLAWYLANRQSRRVVILDLDLHNGNCALALNLSPTPGLREALTNPLRIDTVFIERAAAVHGDHLFVLSGEEPLHSDTHFGADAVETLTGALRAQFHYVIADIPRIPAAPYRHALETADVRVLVADQTLRAVRDTVRLREALGDGDPPRANFLVVNRAGEGGRHGLTLEEMARVRLRPKFVIPFSPKLCAVPGMARRGPIAEAVAALAAEISGRMPQRNPWWRFAR